MFWKQNNLLKFSFSPKISKKWISFSLHFLSLSFSILSPGKAIFFFCLATFHHRYPSQVYPKFIPYVYSPISLKYVSLLDCLRKLYSEERTAHTCHYLIIYISKIHFSPLCLCFPLRLKRNQGIGSRIGWALDRIRPKSVPSMEPDC